MIEDVLGRVVNVEWVEKVRMSSGSDHIFPYDINENFHDMIKECPRDRNNAFALTRSYSLIVVANAP